MENSNYKIVKIFMNELSFAADFIAKIETRLLNDKTLSIYQKFFFL